MRLSGGDALGSDIPAGHRAGDPAAAAIDRVVHHSVILELTVPSYRAEAARARTQDEEK